MLYQNFQTLGVPSYTEEEYRFADTLFNTYASNHYIPGIGAQYDFAIREKVQALCRENPHSINDFLMPLYQDKAFNPGSSDVGDVSWQCPTAQIHVAAWPNGCPGHSWQIVSCGHTQLGHKAAIHAGKVLAAAVIDLMTEPELLKAAKEEFLKRTEEGYTCPTPEDAVPVIPD